MSEKISIVEKNVETNESMAEKSGDELAVAYHIDPEEEKRVLRKLDCVILPLMALIYFFQCE